MNVGKTLFAQLMEFMPWTSFGRIVDRYGGNASVRRMTCAKQFQVMVFAQLTWRESLRDIEATLGANAIKLGWVLEITVKEKCIETVAHDLTHAQDRR